MPGAIEDDVIHEGNLVADHRDDEKDLLAIINLIKTDQQGNARVSFEDNAKLLSLALLNCALGSIRYIKSTIAYWFLLALTALSLMLLFAYPAVPF
jgi:hypothetical protein